MELEQVVSAEDPAAQSSFRVPPATEPRERLQGEYTPPPDREADECNCDAISPALSVRFFRFVSGPLPQRFRRLHRPGIKVLGHDQVCTPKSAREPPEITTVVE